MSEEGMELRIRGGGPLLSRELDCGESGFCLRAASALAALRTEPITLLGRGSLATRPVDMVLEPIRSLGAACASTGGHPPLFVHGPLRGGRAMVDGGASSQALSGLLLALPRARGDSELELRGLHSVPYVRMTLELLAAFGVRIEASADLHRFCVPGSQTFRAVDLEIEGDWSSAAFLLVAGALAGDVELEGLKRDSTQADRAILQALELSGVCVEWAGDKIRARQSALFAFDFDATDCPDLVPPLAALAVHARGRSRIRGAGRLRHKESDRAEALVTELGRMGARLAIRGDSLEIEGGPLRGGSADSRGDHRIAMACAIAALLSREGLELDGESCVAKSYPDFFAHLDQLRMEP